MGHRRQRRLRQRPTGGAVSGSSLALENLEWSFGQDLNNDGAIGPPSSVPSTVIQTDGSTTLTQFGTTNAEYVMKGSGGTGQALQYQDTPVTAGEFGTWTLIGAAQLEAGGYEVAWKNTATGLYTVWDTDADGNYVSDPIASVSGSSFALEDLEPSFQQDLNGDGFLSTQLITTGDTVDLTGQTEPTTINLGENDTAHASGGLNASSLTIVGTPDAITLGSGADIVEYALTPGSGVETIANFSLGQDMLNIDLNGAAEFAGSLRHQPRRGAGDRLRQHCGSGAWRGAHRPLSEPDRGRPPGEPHHVQRRTRAHNLVRRFRPHLDELEDLYRTESRFEDLREGRSESIPLNDLMRRHGVEN